MPSVDVDGTTIEYEREGAGEPVLLVMGLALMFGDMGHDLPLPRLAEIVDAIDRLARGRVRHG